MVQGVALIDSAEAPVVDMVVHDLFVQEPLKDIAQKLQLEWSPFPPCFYPCAGRR